MVYKVLKNNLFFLIPYVITLLAAGITLVNYSKPDIHIWLNGHNSGFSDWVFSHVTFLGDGIFVICIGVLLLFYSLRSTVFLLTAYLSTGLVVQILKRIVFADYLRPVKYFHDTVQLHLVDGVRLLNGHSFPSGHSASAFALFLSLAIISRNRYIQVICFILACIVAYSRVYLSQHFLVDIFAGSLIGVTGTLALYPLFYNKNMKWHQWSLLKSGTNE
jgi:membrane-associated phospholipid phosphatase